MTERHLCTLCDEFVEGGEDKGYCYHCEKEAALVRVEVSVCPFTRADSEKFPIDCHHGDHHFGRHVHIKERPS